MGYFRGARNRTRPRRVKARHAQEILFDSSVLLLGSTPTYLVAADALYMEDEIGSLYLTPLQGAEIIGNGSAYANLSDQVATSLTTAWDVEISFFRTSSETNEEIFIFTDGFDNLGRIGFTTTPAVYCSFGGNSNNHGTITSAYLDKWTTLKMSSDGTGYVQAYLDGNALGSAIDYGTGVVNFERLFANPSGTQQLVSKVAYIKITIAGTVTNYWLPTPNTDGDNSPSILVDIVGGNHAKWVGATLSTIATRSNQVIAPENELGYHIHEYFNGGSGYRIDTGTTSCQNITMEVKIILTDKSTASYPLLAGGIGFIQILATTGQIQIQSAITGGAVNTGYNLDLYKYYHIVFTNQHSTGAFALFVNGVSVYSDTGSTTGSENLAYKDVMNNSGTGYCYGFLYDEARIYNGYYSNGVPDLNDEVEPGGWDEATTTYGTSQQYPIPCNALISTEDAFGASITGGGVKRNPQVYEFPVPTFDGSAYVDFGAISYLNDITTGDFTVGCFVNDLGSLTTRQHFFGNAFTSGLGLSIGLDTAGKIYGITRDDVAPKLATAPNAYVSGIESAVFWRDSGSLSIELGNGDSTTGVTGSGDISSALNFYISNSGGTNIQQGNIWAIFLLNRKMTSTERSAYHADGTIPSDALIIPTSDYNNQSVLTAFQGSTAYQGAITGATFPAFWANTVNHPSASWNLQKGWCDYNFLHSAGGYGDAEITDTNADGLANSWGDGYLGDSNTHSIITGGGFSENAQKVEVTINRYWLQAPNNSLGDINGRYFLLSMKYASNHIPAIYRMAPQDFSFEDTNGDVVTITNGLILGTATHTIFGFLKTGLNAGDWLAVSELTLVECDASGNSLYKVPANTNGQVPNNNSNTDLASYPSGGLNGDVASINWNPYDLKEINDAYANEYTDYGNQIFDEDDADFNTTGFWTVSGGVTISGNGNAVFDGLATASIRSTDPAHDAVAGQKYKFKISSLAGGGNPKLALHANGVEQLAYAVYTAGQDYEIEFTCDTSGQLRLYFEITDPCTLTYFNVVPVETHHKNLVVNGGTPETTDWVDSDSNGFADNYVNVGSNISGSIVTGNGFLGNAQRVDHTVTDTLSYVKTEQFPITLGYPLRISFKHRNNNGLRFYNGITAITVPANTGDAEYFEIELEGTGTYDPLSLRIRSVNAAAGDWFEIDELRVWDDNGDQFDLNRYRFGDWFGGWFSKVATALKETLFKIARLTQFE